MPFSRSQAFAVLASLGLVSAQAGPNTFAATHPNQRTLSENGTWMLAAIDKNSVQSLVPYTLLDLPLDDTSLFPTGFPSGMHPVIFSTYYENDIRLNAAFIQSLKGGAINVPFVDRLSDGKTPFQYSIRQYIGGTNGRDLMSVVPALVGSLINIPLYISDFMPNNAAYEAISQNEFTSQVKQTIVPNPVSGPGVYPAAFDLDFFNLPEGQEPLYTPHTFHALINQPQILLAGTCANNAVYFNQTFTNGIQRIGNVTMYQNLDLGAIQGHYSNVGTYCANGEQVGPQGLNLEQDCAAAAGSNDPDASIWVSGVCVKGP